jgi:hypothetical protein
MPQGERLCGNSRAGIGALSAGDGSGVESDGATDGAAATGEAGAPAAGDTGVIALGAAAEGAAIGAAGWSGCATAGAEAGAATAFSWGGADCANPGDIASTPTRHKAGAHSLVSKAVVGYSFTNRILHIATLPRWPFLSHAIDFLEMIASRIFNCFDVGSRQQTEIVIFVNADMGRGAGSAP